MKKIGVVIPACNEEAYIEHCLLALKTAQLEFFQSLESVESLFEIKILVVLDTCTDQTAQKVQKMAVESIQCDFQCVGKTRHLGIQQLIAQGCDWICCTDADSRVQPDWFKVMLEHQPTEVICGVVELDEWDHLSPGTRFKYLSHYQNRMNHHHVHGANLCFKSDVYIKNQGFEQLACHEDVEFIQRLERANVQITWSNRLRVLTSSRLSSKVTEGFASFLQNLETQEAVEKPIIVYK